MEKEAALKIDYLSKRFGPKIVLSNVSLEIKQGEIFGIIGPTGVGKTTLFECIIGFLKPEEGDIFINYKENFYSLVRHSKHFRPLFGFSSQYPSFYNNLTCAENLEYFGILYGIAKERVKYDIDRLLHLVGLQDDKNTLAGNLSGGMQKRLEIACSIIHHPQILLMDEPTADLDIVSRKQIWQLIREINDRGMTVVLSSHLLQEMEQLCDRVAVMNKGRIVAVGTPEQLKRKHGTKSLQEAFEELTYET